MRFEYSVRSMGGKSNAASLIGLNSTRHFKSQRHDDGTEAPRNSLDLPLGTDNNHHAINIKLMVKQPSSKVDFHHHIGTPAKMSINDEDYILENNKRGGPSVVARLMGMDRFPPEKGPTINDKECSDENLRKQIARVPRYVSTKTDLSTSLTTFNQTKEKSSTNCNKQYSSSSTKSSVTVRPHRREHPQEELLQKFKKEFESWQASKSWECSSKSNLNQNESSQVLKNEQSVGLEDLNMDKLARCVNSRRYQVQKNPIEANVHTSGNNVKTAPLQLDDFNHEGNMNKKCVPRTIDEMGMRRKLAADSFGPASRSKIQEKRSRSCSPTRIVILKPSSDINEIEEPRGGSSEAPERSNSMEHFLEEVKERLQLEIEGKGRNDPIRRTNAAHTSLHERSADPKQLARDIAKHVRGSATREVGETSLIMPESARSYRDYFHLNEPDSSESIKHETRKFISERLKNALRDDTKLEKSTLNDGRAENSLWIKGKERSKPMTEGKGASFWEDKKAVNESIPKYLRREQLKMTACDVGTMSPQNLTKSFSAPASGTIFDKLPLEDHQMLTDAQFCQKEDSEIYSELISRNKKDGFNFKGRVSNLKRNLSFKGKIFGRKMSSMGELTAETSSYAMPIETMPSVIRSFSMVQDNYTEVPPTPASISSTPATENNSPVSPLEVPFVIDNSSTQVSGELGLKHPGFGNQPHEGLSSKESEEVETETQVYVPDEALHIDGHADSYVRDILTVSGLCNTSPSNGLTESISSCVFDEVEDKVFKCGNADSGCCRLGATDIDRKLLFDLMNESLPGALSLPMMSKRWTEGPLQSLRGRELADELLRRIQMYADPMVDQPQSVDKALSWDMKSKVWCTASHDDISYIMNQVEGLFIEEMLDEFVSDVVACDGVSAML